MCKGTPNVPNANAAGGLRVLGASASGALAAPRPAPALPPLPQPPAALSPLPSCPASPTRPRPGCTVPACAWHTEQGRAPSRHGGEEPPSPPPSTLTPLCQQPAICESAQRDLPHPPAVLLIRHGLFSFGTALMSSVVCQPSLLCAGIFNHGFVPLCSSYSYARLLKSCHCHNFLVPEIIFHLLDAGYNSR